MELSPEELRQINRALQSDLLPAVKEARSLWALPGRLQQTVARTKKRGVRCVTQQGVLEGVQRSGDGKAGDGGRGRGDGGS